MCRREDADERLLKAAAKYRGEGVVQQQELAWRSFPVEKRLEHALVQGIADYLEEDA